MRTTISLDDGLGQDIKRRAARAGQSVSALIESLLREALHRGGSPERVPPFRLVTVKGTGVLPGVDLDRAAKMIEWDDAAGPARKRLDRAGR